MPMVGFMGDVWIEVKFKLCFLSQSAMKKILFACALPHVSVFYYICFCVIYPSSSICQSFTAHMKEVTDVDPCFAAFN